MHTYTCTYTHARTHARTQLLYIHTRTHAHTRARAHRPTYLQTKYYASAWSKTLFRSYSVDYNATVNDSWWWCWPNGDDGFYYSTTATAMTTTLLFVMYSHNKTEYLFCVVYENVKKNSSNTLQRLAEDRNTNGSAFDFFNIHPLLTAAAVPDRLMPIDPYTTPPPSFFVARSSVNATFYFSARTILFRFLTSLQA